MMSLLNNSDHDKPTTRSFVIHLHSNHETLLNFMSSIDCAIIILGTLGNLTSCYLLTRKRLRAVSSMRYLAALTLVDTLCLYGWYLSSVYRQLNGETYKRLENLSPAMCKFLSYMSFTCLQMSSILLCLLSLDRLLIITSAKWRSKYANSLFANRIIIVFALLVCSLNLIIPINLGNEGYVQYTIKNYDDSVITFRASSPQHQFSRSISINEVNDLDIDEVSDDSILSNTKTYTSPNVTMCLCYDDQIKILRIWNKLHLCLYSLIPFPILCILNLIVIRLTREAALSAAQMNANVKKFKNGQQFVTRLLLFLTLSFFLTTLPSTVVYAFWHRVILRTEYGRVILNLLNTLQFSRHALNWIIYIYSSSFMREEFKKCISCAESDYELAEAAALAAERPSVAIEILRQLELNNTTLEQEYEYYNYKKKQLLNRSNLNEIDSDMNRINNSINLSETK